MTDEIRPHTVEGVTIHTAHKEWAMGELGPCLFVVWRGVVTEAALHKINDQIFAFTQQHPGKAAYINVIERGSPTPPAPLRKLTMAGLAKPGKALSCMVAVIEGHELRLTVVRAILTGMALLRSQGQPTKFFKNTQEMSLWVDKLLAMETGFDREIVRAAEVIRRALPT